METSAFELVDAFVERFHQAAVDAFEAFDLGADFGDRCFGAGAVLFVDQVLHVFEVRVDLAGGRPRQQVGAAAAGGDAERQRGGEGEDEQRCLQTGHDFESRERP